MTPEEFIANINNRFALLEKKFNLLVGMVEKDMTAMKLEIAGLKAAMGQGGGQPPASSADEIVGSHPVTGKPVTRAQLEADPKLRMRMQFGEEGA